MSWLEFKAILEPNTNLQKGLFSQFHVANEAYGEVVKKKYITGDFKLNFLIFFSNECIR